MIRPLGDRVLVRCVKEPPLSSVLVIPDIAQPNSTLGVVEAVGTGRRSKDGHLLPLDVKPGDIVRWGPWTDYEDGELVLIQEADIRFKLAEMPKIGAFPEEVRWAE